MNAKLKSAGKGNSTGTLLVLLDENGDEAGRMVYDGFGGVLTSTMPTAVSNALPGMPDAVTGLVNLGDGRYYNPALGRPLQPNPAGGPPTVPQALNRYAATPLGQPGVYQTAASRPDLTVLPLAVGAAKSSAAEILGRATWGPLGKSATTVLTKGQTFIYVRASRTALGNAYRTIQNWGGSLVEPGSLGSIPANHQLHEAIFGLGLTEKTAADLISEAGLPTKGRYKAAVSFTAIDEVVETSRQARFAELKGFKVGLATDVLLSVGFQLYGDSYDPFLTSGQRVARVGVAAAGGAASTFVGAGVGAGAGFAAGWLCGPGVVICAPVGAVVGTVAGSVATSYAWGNYIQPYIFEAFNLNSARNLAPLP